ncbi:MAG: hypothetical protein AAGA21_03855 [Pseudomonadota bacterium]
MYQVIGLAQLLRLTAMVAAAVVVIFGLIAPPSNVAEGLRLIGWAGTFLVILAIAFGANWGLWRWLWRFDWANRVIYPDLTGTWRGTIKSNWPSIEAMKDAADRRRDPFDIEKTTVDLEEKGITVRIRASWFDIHMKLETDDGYSKSESIMTRPERRASGDHRLFYVFANKTEHAKRSDSGGHRGAAIVNVEWGAEPSLSGQYWTDRNWEKGFNTAGLISIKRISKDPDFKTEDRPEKQA